MSRKKFVPVFVEAIFNFEMADKSNRYMARWRVQDGEFVCRVYDQHTRLQTWVTAHGIPNRTRSLRLIIKTIKEYNQKKIVK